MKNKKKISLILATGLLVLPLVFSGCVGGGNQPAAPTYELTLEVWGVFDDASTFERINKEYKARTDTVAEVKYRKISSDPVEYEKELIDAIASGRAPDIAFFKHNWLPKHKEKAAILPNSEDFLVKNKDEFVDVFYQDFVDGEAGERNVYAMPLYCDTLALYYNKDIFNQAGILYPPKTWDDVREYTKQLTNIDEFGNIKRSAIALGRSEAPGAINRSTDILSLLMMQNGSIMSKKDSSKRYITDFNKSSTGVIDPGTSALEFYTQFAQGDSDVYTWNTKMEYSVDAFRYRKVAMMLNYSHMADRLKRMDPKLQFEIASMPQIDPEKKVNYANYWGLAVVKNKGELGTGVGYKNEDRIKESWNYIKFVTNKQSGEFDATKIYLDESNNVAARKDLLEEQRGENFRGVFAEQALTAKSWRQPDELAIEDILADAIDDTVSGNMTVENALETATSRINVLWK